jgi:hypothetical protein
MRALVIGLVPLIGAAFGWDAAMVSHHARTHADTPPEQTAALTFPSTSTFVVVPVSTTHLVKQPEDSEVTRLQARNRRLEALVLVLRNRDLEKQH